MPAATVTPVIAIPWKRLDMEHAEALKQAGIDFAAAGANRLIVDLSEVEFIDSSGLGALVGLAKRMGGRGQVALCGLKEPALNLLRMTRMHEVFTFCNSVAEARMAQGEG